ncbi:MAG: hypothetical protein VR64_11495 [Desulfatitalea sp. BRH_c12]|nr:MAG: hypothetical protein VR64_11495 [Desulfatitalea sp. BRH_c12]
MQEKMLGLGDYLDILKRRKWSFLIPTAGVLIVALVLAFMLPSIYRSEATIFIEEQEIPVDFVTSTVTSLVEQRIQAIHQRIMGYTNLLQIINANNLYPTMRDKFTSEEIVAKMRSDVSLEPVSAEVMDRRTGRSATATIAFILGYEGRDPQVVQHVTNVLVSLFLEQNRKERVQKVEDTSSFLEAEIAKIKTDMSTIDNKIADFKEQHIHKLPEMLQFNLQSLNNIERDLENIDQQIRTLKERESYFQSQLSTLNPSLDNESRLRLEALKIELVALTQRFSEEYPDVKNVRAEITKLEEKLNRTESGYIKLPDNPAFITMSAQLASVRSELVSVQQQKANLQRERIEHKRRVADTPSVEDQYNDLISTRKSTQDKYDDLMAKLMNARVAHGLETEEKGERFTLVEAPRLPEKPYKPNRMVIVLIGAVLGLGAGFGFAALREFTDQSVQDPDILAGMTSFPVLAMVPLIETAGDIWRRRLRRVVATLVTIAIIAGGVTLFHFQVMDWDVFWAKLVRRLSVLNTRL